MSIKLWLKQFFPAKTCCECCKQERTLSDVDAGHSVAITCLRGEEGVCQRLREMGFCESAIVEKVSYNGALICRVCDAKVALSRRLAQNIIVQDVCQGKDHARE